MLPNRIIIISKTQISFRITPKTLDNKIITISKTLISVKITLHKLQFKVHDYFLRSGYRGDTQLVHKVIDMYCKCGSMVDARRVFDHMSDRNMDTWHLIINGYAANGLGDDGLMMFEEMRTAGLEPNEETFLAVLESCAAADAIKEGFIHFEVMQKEYKISPKIEHYLGVLGVFGKPGHLAQALEYVEKLPFEPTTEIWEASKCINPSYFTTPVLPQSHIVCTMILGKRIQEMCKE